MALSSFTKELQNVVERAGGAFASDDDGVNYYDLGVIKNAQANWSAVTTDPDVAGRPKMLAADVEVTFVMQQTSNTELTNLGDLLNPSGNGLWLKLTEDAATAATAGAANGKTFKNVIMVIEGELNFDGSESMMTVTFSGRVSVPGLTALGSSDELVFDA